MSSSQLPHNISDAPTAVIEVARTDPRIILNLRADQWPAQLLQQCRQDKVWPLRMSLNNGLLMAPSLTDFMRGLKGGEPLAICCQNYDGNIAFLRANCSGVYWLTGSSIPDGQDGYGIHGQIRVERQSFKHAPCVWHIWASFILAVAILDKKVRPTSAPDPLGEQFLTHVKKSGKPKD